MNPANKEPGPRVPRRDARGCGFSDRVTVEYALAWIDAHAQQLPAEDVSVGDAVGHVLASRVVAHTNFPPVDCAGIDGYALRAGETVGASDYNPLLLDIQNADYALRPATAARVSAGVPLPDGADAVLPFDAVKANDSVLEVHRAVAKGAGVESKGQQVAAGATIDNAAKIVHPQHAGVLASVGIDLVSVVRKPRVRLVIAGPKPIKNSQMFDADSPMLRALVNRDGGVIESVISGADQREAMCSALSGLGADVILVAGRTGVGHDDVAPVAIADVGELAIHGVAVRPGDSMGMGEVGGIPVLLMPGEPLACFCAYELFAGRLIRRLGGRSPDFPHVLREAEVKRKIVSVVGFVDVCQVRLVDGGIEPVGSPEFSRLASAVGADGFVLISAALEGFAPGARVGVHLYQK